MHKLVSKLVPTWFLWFRLFHQLSQKDILRISHAHALFQDRFQRCLQVRFKVVQYTVHPLTKSLHSWPATYRHCREQSWRLRRTAALIACQTFSTVRSLCLLQIRSNGGLSQRGQQSFKAEYLRDPNQRRSSATCQSQILLPLAGIGLSRHLKESSVGRRFSRHSSATTQ